jgi:PAS domain S-box-containing protein
VTAERQAILLNAVPLLVVGGLYLLVALTLAPSLWRERRRIRTLELTLALVFPAVGAGAILAASAVLRNPEPFPGNRWLALAAILLGALPPILYFIRFGQRELLLTGSRRALEAEEQRTEAARRRDALARLTAELAGAAELEAFAGILVDRACDLLDVDFAGLTLVEGRLGRGLAARARGGREIPWGDLDLDLEVEPSAIASAAFELAPVVLFDVPSSSPASRRLAGEDARSALFVPLVAGDGAIAVLGVGTTKPHVFGAEEIARAQELCDEAALALERLRSAGALAEALDRERLVARISLRLRSELDLERLLETATEETAAALSADRCFVRLEDGGGRPILREWRRAELEPAASAPALPVSDLAVARRQTIAVDDLEAARSPAGLDSLLALGSRSVLATPIVVLDRVIGVFAAHRTEARPWSDDAVALAEAVAHEVGLALHTSRLLEENRLRLEQQTALLNAAQVLTADLEVDSVLPRLVAEAVRVVGGDAADCWIFDPDGRTLRCRAVHGLPESLLGRRIPPEGNIGSAISGGRPVLKRQFSETEEPAPSAPYAEFAEVMDAPIVVGGRVHGVLGICARDDGAFDEADLELLDAFAYLASLALQNAEVYEERSRQERVQRGLSRVAALLAEPLSREQTLEAVAQAAREALGGAFAAVVTRRGDAYALAGGRDLPPQLADALAEGFPAPGTPLAEAAGERRIAASSSPADDERFDDAFREAARTAGAGALVAIPVAYGEADLALVLVFFAAGRRPSDDDLELAEHLAAAAGGSLGRSLVFEEERNARALAQQLARIASVLATELDPAAVLDEVVRQAPPLVGADAAAIRLLEDDELVVAVVEGVPGAEELVGGRAPVTGRLAGDVVQSRAPLALEDAGADARHRAADPVLRGGFRAYAAVPLVAAEGGVHGVLSLYCREPKAWRHGEVEALTALAAGASAALQNAELYQRVAIEKERSFAILANIADGIVAVDREGRVVLWNRAAEEISGVPAAEALGHTPEQVLGRRLEGDGTGTARDRLVSIVRGGDEVWLSLSEAVMRDPAGAVAGRIFAFRDISADRLVEQMKTEFVTTVSQELRRPLTSIYGFAETLLRRDVNFGEEERLTFLGYIASESERLTTIVDALLNVARLDAGDLQISVAPIDVATAVSDVVSGHEAAAANGHRFVVELEDEPLRAEADPDKLRQVLANLVDNAVKYSPEGGTVTVAARRRDDRVEISVSDQGVGIPEGEQERIFRKFYRADAGGSRPAGGGTGLGLFIVRGLVQAMGGRIWVRSREGEGASFTFELPAVLAGTRSEAPPQRV